MTRRTTLYLVSTVAAAALLVACGASGPAATSQSKMGFFLTSVNPGKGADFGGLAGADRYCQSLAASAGAGNRTWRAYLSNSAMAGSPAVNARDRIGSGPWLNAKGEVIATSVDNLHGPDNKLTKQSALTEKGQVISGRGDAVNLHDILTGSSPDGRAVSDGKDNTCGNWTKGGEGSAIVGHHDRVGLNDSPPMKSWNSSHPTRGCSMDALKSTGGGGLLYCFAQN
jgi:hypothetical protein